jgi:aspartyl-tRNA(Asn)/glutamyl-tRNA(Gln) amidotransferase subunit A
MLNLMDRIDALLMPTTRVAAPKSSEASDYFLVLSHNCIPWSFIGFPAISVPCGWTVGGLPVGAQLVAGPLEDGRLLALAAALETALAVARPGEATT